MITLEYLLTSLIVVLIPGTGVVFTISTGLLLGRKASLYAALGCTLGIVPHLLASVLGLAAVLHVSATAFQVLKLAGAAYMLYLAWAMWREQGTIAVSREAEATSGGRLVLKAFLLNILNPKLSIFFLAFIPQFVTPGAAAPLAQMLVLSSVFMGMTFVVFAVYGVLSHGFRQFVIDSPRFMTGLQRGFSGIFAALGVNLAFSDR